MLSGVPPQPTARATKASEDREHRNERRIRGTGAREKEGKREVERSKSRAAEVRETY